MTAQRLDRREFMTLDIDSFEEPDLSNHSETLRVMFESRQLALRLYHQGESHQEIFARTHRTRQQVSIDANRFLARSQNGRINGWNGIIPYVQIQSSNSTQRTDKRPRKGAKFARGELKRLFDRHPAIQVGLENVISGKNPKKNPNGKATGNTTTPQQIHEEFLNLCRAAGVDDSEYPLVTVEKGRKAIRDFRKRFLAKKSRASLRVLYGNEVDRELQNGTGSGPSTPPVTEFFQRVEIDGHELPYKGAIEIPGAHPLRPILKALSSMTVVVVIECGSSSVLGYELRYGKNYSSMDTFRAVRKAIVPWKPMELDPNLGIHYPENGGLPSGLIPELAWALWRDLHWDNFSSHASEFLLTQLPGCVPIQSPVAAPDTHAIVESFNSVLDRFFKGSACSTLGGIPKASKTAERLRMTTQIIEQLMDVVIATYNAGSPRGSNISRIELLRRFASDPRSLIAYVPEHRRASFKIYDFEYVLTIQGSKRRSKNVSIVRPHLYFREADYTSNELKDRFDLIGAKLLIRGDSGDLRTIECWNSDGSYFGSLDVCGSWKHGMHGFETRSMFGKLRHQGKLVAADNPVLQVEMSLRQLALKDSRYAAHLARVMKETGGSSAFPVSTKKECEDIQAPAPEAIIVDEFTDLGTMY